MYLAEVIGVSVTQKGFLIEIASQLLQFSRFCCLPTVGKGRLLKLISEISRTAREWLQKPSLVPFPSISVYKSSHKRRTTNFISANVTSVR